MAAAPPRPAGVFRALGIAASAVVLAACAEPAVRPLPSGPMDVLGPVPAFEPSPLPGDWVTEGTVGQGQLAVVERDGVPALRVVNGAHSFVAAKPTRASVLATPYLSWAWYMEPQDGGTHPVRLVVGFQGGPPKGRPADAGRRRGTAGVLPPHDRAIVLIWGFSALQRGSLSQPAGDGRRQAAMRYTARGGRENTRSWWLETVDLSDIYRRSWPGDDPANVRITFIGIGAAAGKGPSPAYLSGIRLSR